MSEIAIPAFAALAGGTLYAAVCAFVAQRFTRARRQHPRPWPDAARPVQLASRDRRASIDGWYLEAAAAAAPPRGAVLFVHGKDGSRGDELKSPSGPLAQAFAAAGFAVLTIDLRGHGTSSHARLTYGLHERHDVLGAVDWLRGQGHARIGVLGASMGASTALMAAADEPAIVALVADSPFADFAQMIERQFRRLSGLPAFFLPGALALGRLLTGVDLRRVRPIAQARALAGRPVLVIHGEGDRFVPVDDARAIAQASGAELWTTATRRHVGSYGSAPADYTERVLAFFKRHLPAPGAEAPLPVAAEG